MQWYAGSPHEDCQKLEAFLHGQALKPAGCQSSTSGPSSWGAAEDRLDMNILLTALDRDKACARPLSASLIGRWRQELACEKLIENVHL
jgi:hypothetical protein